MKSFFQRALAIFLGSMASIILMFSLSSVSAQFQDIQEYKPQNAAKWVLQPGDWLLINVDENILQFVREDHSKASKPLQIGSGINNGKKIHYLGMTYNPRTPEGVWEILGKNQQNWFTVFGSEESDEQLFFRFFEVRGERRIHTHYGIHTTPEIERILDEEKGFGSWGCVLTRYDLLKTIEQLYELNEQKVKVVTTRQKNEDVLALLQAF